MKYIYIAFLFFFSLSFSQVSVSRSGIGLFKDLKKEDYSEIKKRTTVFVIDSFDKNDFEEMLSSFWTINKYVILTREEYNSTKENYITEDYSVFVLSGFVLTSTSKSGSTTEYLYVSYKYFYYTNIKEKKEKLKFDTVEVASIFFGGDAESMWNIIRHKSFLDIQNQMYNYKLGFMKNYLQYIQEKLSTDGYSWAAAVDYDKKEIKKLSKQTLYIPSYIKTSYNGWTGQDTERENPDELLKNYEFKYEWISDEDLDEKILEAKEDFFYLMYTKVNASKFVSVVNGKTGEIIYRDYQSLSYKLKSKDIKDLNNKID